MVRQQVDDQSPDLAVAHRGQLRRDDFDMPVHRELGPRAELVETALREAGEIEPQQCVVLGPRNIRAESWFLPDQGLAGRNGWKGATQAPFGAREASACRLPAKRDPRT